MSGFEPDRVGSIPAGATNLESKMNLPEFFSALIDDITGKDANGRTAEQKKQYSEMIIAVLAVATIVLGLTFPLGAAVTGLILARKIWLHFTNTF